MALSNYTELQASVASWLNRTDLTANIVDFIALAESKMNHGIAINDREAVSLRVDEMKTSSTYLWGVTDDDVTRNAFAIPSDYLDLEEMRPNGTWTGNDGAETVTANAGLPHLERVSTHRLDDFIVGSGIPAMFSNDSTADNWIIWPAGGNYRIRASYWAELTPLATTATSTILSRYPEAYLYGALSEAETFLRLTDTKWRDKFIAAINSANTMTKRAAWSGSALRTRNPYGWSRVI